MSACELVCERPTVRSGFRGTVKVILCLNFLAFREARGGGSLAPECSGFHSIKSEGSSREARGPELVRDDESHDDESC